MQIVFIGPFALRPKGTVPIRMLPMAQELVRRGHEVTVLLPPYDNAEYSGKAIEVDGVSVRNARLHRPFPPTIDPLCSFQLFKDAAALRPDVVHIFKPKGHSGNAALLLAVARSLRLMRTALVLDTDDLEGPGGINDYLAANGRYPRPLLALIAWQERAIPRRVQAVTTASAALREQVTRNGVREENVFTVPNGYQRLAGFPPSEAEMAALRGRLRLDDGPTVLLYTRFFEFALERCVRILAGIRDGAPSARCLVVGKGQFGEEKAFLELCRGAGLADHLTYAGWVEPDDLAAHFAVCDIALYPFDNTPLNVSKCPGKLVELMSVGMPVIADRVGEIPSYIVHGESGLLTDPEDPNDLASGALNLLEHPDLARGLGEGALSRVSTVFSWERLVDVVEAAYAKALG